QHGDLLFGCNAMTAEEGGLRPFPAAFAVLTGAFSGLAILRGRFGFWLMPPAMLRPARLLLVLAVACAATTALAPVSRAQIGTIFGNQPPRPPSNVGPPANNDPDDDVPDIPQGRILPAPMRPPQGSAMPPPVQTQPLPPPPGATLAPPGAPPGQ